MTQPSILILSFHYPPTQSSSGLLRALAFSRDLAELGWDVTVLTSALGDDSGAVSTNKVLLPAKVKVIRTCAIDVAKSLSIRGRYPGFFEWPDRYNSWAVSATFAGYRHIKRHATDLIFSTYPIASAHLAGYWLAKLTGKPWVADFRDPMLMEEHPDTKLRRNAHQWIEKRAIARSAIATVTNDGARQHYIDKYPNKSAASIQVVENGYDEALFEAALTKTENAKSTAEKPLKILHSGSLYPNHRDPAALFAALSKLTPQWEASQRKIELVLRATGYDDYYRDLIEKYRLADYVKLAGPVGYVESIKEILDSEILLLIQGASCNDQIPAKLYEYLRSGRPVLALTNAQGATARKIANVPGVYMADNTSEAEISHALTAVLTDLSAQEPPQIARSEEQLETWSRRRASSVLDAILHGILEPMGPSRSVKSD